MPTDDTALARLLYAAFRPRLEAARREGMTDPELVANALAKGMAREFRGKVIVIDLDAVCVTCGVTRRIGVCLDCAALRRVREGKNESYRVE